MIQKVYNAVASVWEMVVFAAAAVGLLTVVSAVS
jgi:hypothetical protein